MPLCAKCHEKEATIHFSAVVDGVKNETMDLCTDCAPSTEINLENLDLKELEALSIDGKKCEFCGRTALSGIRTVGGAIYWCLDCGVEFGRILSDLCISERPDLMQRMRASSFLTISSDPELEAWSEATNQKAVQILKEKRRQVGRDKGS